MRSAIGLERFALSIGIVLQTSCDLFLLLRTQGIDLPRPKDKFDAMSPESLRRIGVHDCESFHVCHAIVSTNIGVYEDSPGLAITT